MCFLGTTKGFENSCVNHEVFSKRLLQRGPILRKNTCKLAFLEDLTPNTWRFFEAFKMAKLSFFQESKWKFGIHIHEQVFWLVYSAFLNSEKVLGKFWKLRFLWWLFFIFSKLSKNFKIWYNSLIVTFNLYVLLKTNRFYFYWWGRFTRTRIFYRNRENITSLWRHLRPTHQSLGKFLRSGCAT